MHIICQQRDLQNAVNSVYRAVASQSTIPILTGILLQASKEKIYLEGTDMELRIKYGLSTQVKEEGKAVIPARYFVDLVKRLPDEEIELGLENDGKRLFMKYGDSIVKLNLFEVEEFPEDEKEPVEYNLAVDPLLFSESIKQVSIAVAKDESRPIFTGIHLELNSEEKFLTMATTDSHRLTLKKVSVNIQKLNKDLSEVVVPSRALNEAARLMGEAQEEIKIGFTETKACFKCGDVVVQSQLIDGQFPSFRDVIPESYKTLVEVEIGSLYDSLSRASLVSYGEYKGKGIVRINIKDNSMSIFSFSNDVGEVMEFLPLLKKEGEDLEIAFDARYLLEVLRVLNSETARIEFTGPLSPAVIKPSEGDSYLYLVLPVRIQ
ncbi:MAG: DNA polymerase III subunit beta [Clostridia bacterium 41_269]|nr:MAG: DNA polymerase III subunit beta [Clostridia bacterium 41_269]